MSVILKLVHKYNIMGRIARSSFIGTCTVTQICRFSIVLLEFFEESGTLLNKLFLGELPFLHVTLGPGRLALPADFRVRIREIVGRGRRRDGRASLLLFLALLCWFDLGLRERVVRARLPLLLLGLQLVPPVLQLLLLRLLLR